MRKIDFLKSYGGKPVTLTNLLTNGNFTSTSNWTAASTSFSVASNEATLLATGTNGLIRQTVSLTNTNIYYFCGWMQSSSSLVSINLTDAVANKLSVFHSGSGSYEFLSGRYTATLTTASGQFRPSEDTRTSGWTTVKDKYATLINLTSAFGSGNEPTKSQMDSLMNNFPEKWLNGTQITFYWW